MTEEGWLQCTEPRRMGFIRETCGVTLSQRKLGFLTPLAVGVFCGCSLVLSFW